MAPTAVTQEPQELQETIKKLASLNPIGHSNNKSAVITGFDPNWGENYLKPRNKDLPNMVLIFLKDILIFHKILKSQNF